MTDGPASCAPPGRGVHDGAAVPAAGRDASAPDAASLSGARAALQDRPLVLVGLMGVGKTTVGRAVAQMLGLRFCDTDDEIERVSTMTVPELFEKFGEPEFRALERRVIDRLLSEGPMVLATGGGAFIDRETRERILRVARTVWLRAELDVLVERTARRDHRPLLRNGDPREILARLIEERHPIYAEAGLVIDSRSREKRDAVAMRVIQALAEPA